MPLMRLSEGARSSSKEAAGVLRINFTATTNHSSAACASKRP
jgi:hypothetical protein